MQLLQYKFALMRSNLTFICRNTLGIYIYICIDTAACQWRIWFFQNSLFLSNCFALFKENNPISLKMRLNNSKKGQYDLLLPNFDFWRSLPLSRLDGDVSHHPKIHIGNFPKCLIFCISIETPKFRKTVRTHFWNFSKSSLKSNFWCFPLGLFHIYYDVIFTLCSDKPE